jgi:hypothetical protein
MAEQARGRLLSPQAVFFDTWAALVVVLGLPLQPLWGRTTGQKQLIFE